MKKIYLVALFTFILTGALVLAGCSIAKKSLEDQELNAIEKDLQAEIEDEKSTETELNSLDSIFSDEETSDNEETPNQETKKDTEKNPTDPSSADQKEIDDILKELDSLDLTGAGDDNLLKSY